jgi:hypothetical protein
MKRIVDKNGGRKYVPHNILRSFVLLEDVWGLSTNAQDIVDNSCGYVRLST